MSLELNALTLYFYIFLRYVCKPENFATQIGVGRSLGRYPKHA
jgi:hypothetical protein